MSAVFYRLPPEMQNERKMAKKRGPLHPLKNKKDCSKG